MPKSPSPLVRGPGGRVLSRYPRGYRGINHETLGSGILSVLAAIPMPARSLGAELTAELQLVKPGEWYPVELLFRAIRRVEERVGRAGLLQMGRNVFKASHAEPSKQLIRSAGDLIYGADGMYRRSNRGKEIGGCEVIVFRPGYAEVSKTTPQHCAMVEGLFSEALRSLSIPASVEQSSCFLQGAPDCRYIFRSLVEGELWMGNHPPAG